MTDLAELDAMKQMAAALESLDEQARQRALQWAISRYLGGRMTSASNSRPPTTMVTGSDALDFQTFAELFNAANPGTERDKALIAAYWIQVCQNSDSFPAQVLNDELKNLGHGIGNITDALTQLKNDRPALALQLKKSGTSKQARKIYKLTHEGLKRVQQLIQNRNASPED